MKKSFITLCAVAALAVPAGAQTVVLSEDFESYADISAVAAVWTGLDSAQYSLESAAGEGAEGSDQWLRSAAAGTNRPSRTYSEVTASDETPVALSYYLRSDSIGNTRSGLSLRDSGGGTNPYIHIGTSNEIAENVWAIRVLGVPGTPSGYYGLDSGPTRVTGEWVKLGFQASGSAVRFYVNDQETVGDELILTGAIAPFGSVSISLGTPHNQIFEYDNILVEHGENASVNDWDLY